MSSDDPRPPAAPGPTAGIDPDDDARAAPAGARLRHDVAVDADAPAAPAGTHLRRPEAVAPAPASLPPVVARLVVEIRSDGSRTVARGALEDAQAGQTVAVESEGTTPLALAKALARSMLTAPFLARAFRGPGLVRAAARALLTPAPPREPGRKPRG